MLVTKKAARPQHSTEASLPLSSEPICNQHLAIRTELPLGQTARGNLDPPPTIHTQTSSHEQGQMVAGLV